MKIPERVVPLFEALVSAAGIQVSVDSLDITFLKDGGMGSFRIGLADRRMGRQAAEVWFVDEDSVQVTAVLNLDESGGLFEVDIWKVDFSPLVKWPANGDLVGS